MRSANLLILALCILAGPTAVSEARPQLVPGEILVKFRAGTPWNIQAMACRQQGSRVVEPGGPAGVVRVAVPRGGEVAYARQYRKSRYVEFAEPNYIATTCELVPSDTYYQSNQWDLRQIQAPAAWELTRGLDSVVVAIIDTGVDYNHPDLSARIVPGYDFYNSDSDPLDDHGHGTAVAGIIGACTDNGIGVAGITWQPKIMPVKVASASGSAPYSAIARGITYSVDNGARVINISMAGSMPSSTLTNAVNYAYQHGCLVVAASGNSSTSAVYYPAACSNALAVGASDQYDQRTSYSNYGSELDVIAPGSAYTTSRGGGYGGFGGTSAASPHAAGVAALVTSMNPALSPTEVAEILKSTSDDVDIPGWDQYTGWGRVNAYSAVLEANAPSGGTQPPPDTQPPTISMVSPANGATVSGVVTLTASAKDNVGVQSVEFYLDGTYIGTAGSTSSLQWDSRSAKNGSHSLVAKATDMSGNSATSAPAAVSVNNSLSYSQTFSGLASAKNPKRHCWQAISTVTVNASLQASGSPDLRLSLYDSRGTLLAQSSGSSITLNPGTLQTGSYVFEVRAVSGKARYELTVAARSP